MIKFRHHRGMLEDSMKTLQQFESEKDLLLYLKEEFPFITTEFRSVDIGHDDRIGWDTYLITAVGYGVVGMADSPLNKMTEGKNKQKPRPGNKEKARKST